MLLCTIIIISNVSFANASSIKTSTPKNSHVKASDARANAVFATLRKLQEEGKISDSQVPDYLKKHGWTVANTKTIHFDSSGNKVQSNSSAGISPMFIDASYYSVTVWATYDDRNLYHWTVYADVTDNSLFSESYPASYDMLSVDWDPSVFDYHDRSADTSYVWLADASKANSGGTLLYNLKDDAPGYDPSQVQPYVILYQKSLGNTTNSTFDIKFVHTYDSTEKTKSQTGNASYTWGGSLTIGTSWTVTQTTTESNWSKADIISIALN